jgi:hypothetical protein
MVSAYCNKVKQSARRRVWALVAAMAATARLAVRLTRASSCNVNISNGGQGGQDIRQKDEASGSVRASEVTNQRCSAQR